MNAVQGTGKGVGTMPKRWWALVAVSLATFMTYLDNNVTNVAIPTIQRSLHLSDAGLEWVVSSYILVFAGLLIMTLRSKPALNAFGPPVRTTTEVSPSSSKLRAAWVN